MIDRLFGGARVANANLWAEHDELESAREFFDLGHIRVRDPRVRSSALRLVVRTPTMSVIDILQVGQLSCCDSCSF
jgi:hypothetical protein